MLPYQEILKLIETVDPEDSDKLYEVDAQVALYLGWIEDKNGFGSNIEFSTWTKPNGEGFFLRPPWFTSSRDALKAIRPTNWFISITQDYDWSWSCEMERAGEMRLGCSAVTEELAELSAIIQTIAYERGEYVAA